MTKLLIAASVGRWFICLSLGLSSSRGVLVLYARKSARVAVVGDISRWGLIGTGCMTGLLAVSRTGVLVRTLTRASMIPMEALQLASGFFGILLGVGPELVEQPLLRDAIVGHDVGCRQDDVLYGPLEICNDALR